MIFIRNTILIGVALPVIAYAGSLDSALAIYALGIAPAVAYGLLRRRLARASSDEGTSARTLPQPDRLSRIRTYISYSAPLMAAEVIYMLVAVVNRAWLA